MWQLRKMLAMEAWSKAQAEKMDKEKELSTKCMQLRSSKEGMETEGLGGIRPLSSLTFETQVRLSKEGMETEGLSGIRPLCSLISEKYLEKKPGVIVTLSHQLVTSLESARTKDSQLRNHLHYIALWGCLGGAFFQ